MAIRGGYSAFSSGPTLDLTPEDSSSAHVPITDSPFNMTNSGPPYAIPPQGDSEFTELEHKLAHKPGVTNPAGLAAKIGVEQIGQKEMTRRSVEARKKD